MKKIFVLLIAVFALSSTLWAEEVQLQYRFEERKTDIWSNAEIAYKEKLLKRYEEALPGYEAKALEKPEDYFLQRLVRKTKMQILFLRDDLARAKVGQLVKGGVVVDMPKSKNFGFTKLNILVNGKPVARDIPRWSFTAVMRYIAPNGANDQLSTPTLTSDSSDKYTRTSTLDFQNAKHVEVMQVGEKFEWIVVEDTNGGRWSVFISYTSREGGSFAPNGYANVGTEAKSDFDDNGGGGDSTSASGSSGGGGGGGGGGFGG